jgi:RNA polymerase sigma-70 factor (ECF subfamily)
VETAVVDDTAPVTQGLESLTGGDPSGLDRLVEAWSARLRLLTHKILRHYPGVRRYDDTDDVFQGAIMRLHRALGQMAEAGESPRSMMALGAVQIHRELVDLTRRYAAAASYQANHGTNVFLNESGARHFVDEAAVTEEPLDRWERFHETVERLTPEQKEVFRLVWYLGADQKTIAAIMGCSERSVKNYWRQAREAVKAALDGDRPQ